MDISLQFGTNFFLWLHRHQRYKTNICERSVSAAFDTVDKDQLLPKLEALGIRGTPLSWFGSYMSGGRQCVHWNGTRSGYVEVRYGVRQGSILGPVLYLVHVADFPDCVKVGDTENTTYADNTGVWVEGDTIKEVFDTLTERAALVVQYMKGNGLSLNASKTQLMVSRRAGNVDELSVVVDGTLVRPKSTLELLGVTFDRSFSFKVHNEEVARSARQRSALVRRLALHVPRGEYLRQLAMGLVLGKVSHALAAVAEPLMEEYMPTGYRPVQVALNDVARTLTGAKRSDHIRVADLLAAARMPHINELVTKAVALEAWKSRCSDDGKDGSMNLIGLALFGNGSLEHLKRPSRSTEAGKIRVPLRGEKTFISHAAKVWNAVPDLRTAETVSAGQKAALAFAKLQQRNI
jgi:predicted RNase H-like HicB family nuclease